MFESLRVYPFGRPIKQRIEGNKFVGVIRLRKWARHHDIKSGAIVNDMRASFLFRYSQKNSPLFRGNRSSKLLSFHQTSSGLLSGVYPGDVVSISDIDIQDHERK